MRKILITGGDPAGIGPELIERALADFLSSASLTSLKDSSIKTSLKKDFSIKDSIGEHSGEHSGLCFIYFNTSSEKHKGKLQNLCQNKGLSFYEMNNLAAYRDLNVLSNEKNSFIFYTPSASSAFPYQDVPPGQASPYCGHLAFRALKESCDFALEFGCDAMLSLPLAKEWVVRSGESKFRGHTDYLAERFGCEVLMLMHGTQLSVIPLTVHIPLIKAARQLKKVAAKAALPRLLKQVRQIPDYQEGNWALCGFNPHAGENGLMGSEEKFLKKLTQKLRKEALPVEGPLAADALFMPSKRRKYRLILSCYHDQGLIPFKALEGTAGVNCTIGLPFLRTSPDHGTAFDIAGQKKADTRSMYRALELAVQGLEPLSGQSS